MSLEDVEKRLGMIENKVADLDRNGSTIFNVYRNTIDQNTKSIRGLEASNIILERLTSVIDKLSDAVTQIQIALVTMSDKLTHNSEDIADVKGDVSKLKESIETVDEKSKFDFIKFIRDNAVGFILGGGLAYILSLIMDTVIKKQ